MIRKTALMAGVAGALFIAAPAFAQDEITAPEMSPSTSPAPASIPQSQATPTPSTSAEMAAETTPAEPQSLRLTAGSNVTSSDGIVLGQLQGAQTNAAGEQELTVKGADGQTRAVPLSGLRQEGEGVVVGWSQAEFNAATPLPAEAAPDVSGAASNVSGEADELTPEPTPAPADAGTAPDPTMPPAPIEPSTNPMSEEPQS